MVRRKKRHHFSRRLSAAWQDHVLVSNYNQETQTTAQVRVGYLIEEGMWAGSLGRSQLRGAWDTEGSVLSSRLLAKNLRTRYVRPVDEFRHRAGKLPACQHSWRTTLCSSAPLPPGPSPCHFLISPPNGSSTMSGGQTEVTSGFCCVTTDGECPGTVERPRCPRPRHGLQHRFTN